MQQGAAQQLHAAEAVAEPEGSHEGPKLVEGFGKGLARDIKTRAPSYLSDFTDGLNIKTLSATFFLFFACLAPAVAFGGLMGVTTAGQIGTIEMIAATAGCGVVYSLTAGQPLTIIGSTGPVLAFTAVLYKTAVRLGLPFLPLYAWVGLWTSALLALASLFSLSNMVLYFTRFTDEIFGGLISVIFIYEALRDLSGLYVNPAVPLATALLSSAVAATTFGTATALRGLRTSPYLVKGARDVLADFAPTIGVVAGAAAAAAAAARHGAAGALQTLAVPAAFTTTAGRPWRVPLLDLPPWARAAALVPALMSTVLLFMDQNITVRLVNAREHKLKKGFGLHLDMAAIAALVAGCSVLGLPWLVAATVRSLAHVRALARYERRDDGGGEAIAAMTETRVSGLAIHAAIGAAILFLRPALARIPLAVLMGLFLYLGAGGLQGNQMAARVALLFTDPAQRPRVPWVTDVKVAKTHLFTGVQLAALSAMVAVKSSPAGVLFPVIIALLAPLRIALERCGLFSKQEMDVLDAE
ncbi:bicarbonate transporter [Tribonema minus]|uniref:Bicarbonate transporter n=1 Tax=Tribonema minus TaxID=303371 RepID=A0A835YV61_9STRA|nr:bicarbonate transporter [Tribonema minus]